MWSFTGTRKYVAEGVEHLVPCEPLTGIGDDPLDDEEFEAAVTKYEGAFPGDQRGAVKASGMYQHTKGRVRSEQPAETPAVTTEEV